MFFKTTAYGIIATIIAVFCFAAFLFIFIHAGYHHKVLSKLGIKDAPLKTNHAVHAWTNCLQHLDYDADIAFLGDSITASTTFEKRFQTKKIINLGYGGDTIAGMTERVSMVAAVTPEMVFVHGGINGLTDLNYERRLAEYAVLLDTLVKQLPNSTIYVQSVLPISKEKERTICSNKTITTYNAHLKKLCQERQLVYIDLHSLYVNKDTINADLTVDGLHLKKSAYKIWKDAIAPYIENNRSAG